MNYDLSQIQEAFENLPDEQPAARRANSEGGGTKYPYPPNGVQPAVLKDGGLVQNDDRPPAVMFQWYFPKHNIEKRYYFNLSNRDGSPNKTGYQKFLMPTLRSLGVRNFKVDAGAEAVRKALSVAFGKTFEVETSLKDNKYPNLYVRKLLAEATKPEPTAGSDLSHLNDDDIPF